MATASAPYAAQNLARTLSACLLGGLEAWDFVRALLLLAVLLAAPTAAATVTVTAVELPERTMAGRPFDVRVSLANDGPEATVYLFGALYVGEGGPCGPADDGRFRGFTHLVQEPVVVPAAGRVEYPAPGERWQHKYGTQDVPAGPPREEELCILVARDAVGPRLEYEDYASSRLSVRQRNAAPEATFTWSPAIPRAAEDARFVATGSDAEGDPVTFRWDFGHVNASGRAVAEGAEATHFFYPAGEHVVTLLASDGLEETRVARTVLVAAADETPTPVTQPARGAPLPWWLGLGALLLVARGAARLHQRDEPDA